VKKPRRVKPTLESTSCAACDLFQTIESSDDKESSTLWISCNGCKRWYHASCAGFKDKREAQDIDKYICADCEPIHGSTTYVRKLSRARTTIDYAGLNKGIVNTHRDFRASLYLANQGWQNHFPARLALATLQRQIGVWSLGDVLVHQKGGEASAQAVIDLIAPASDPSYRGLRAVALIGGVVTIRKRVPFLLNSNIGSLLTGDAGIIALD
jgi:hypothetical protein